MKNFDVIIIGAGIIGLSTAYELLKKDSSLKICILEKEPGIAFHQTGHNSGVIHSGIYYKPGTAKAVNCINGYKMLTQFCDSHEIPYEICGKIIIAVEEAELNTLQELYKRGVSNKLSGIKLISNKEIKEIEPYATGIQGIFVPQTGIVNYRTVCEKIQQDIKDKGVVINFLEQVLEIKQNTNDIKIKSNKSEYNSPVLISCAGLYADKIGGLISNKKAEFRIIPFRGEYYHLRNTSNYLIKNLIYPVPDPEFPFLGVHFTRKIVGIVEAGPNAVLAFSKEGYKKNDFNLTETIDTLSFKGFRKLARRYWKTGIYELYRSFSKKEFVKSLQRLVPQIKAEDIIPGGSGVRAQACDSQGKLIDDFLLIENERIINVCNAPSPAATSSFSIGETISEKIIKKIS